MSNVRRTAFTLVELLVVIGIIAVLISVLLPALGAARRQSQATKCLASLREIGNAFQMYAIDSKGYYPPAQLKTKFTDVSPTAYYNLYGTDFPADNYGAYWFNFLNKYVSKEKIGNEDTGGNTVDSVKTKSVFWGCPSFEAYNGDVTTSGTNRVQPGYGMNGYPTYDVDYPRTTTTSSPFGGPPTVVPGKIPYVEYAWTDKFDSSNDTRFYPGGKAYGFIKQKYYVKRGAERMLVADSRFWLADAGRLTSTTIPPQMTDVNDVDPSVSSDTYVALWRHGKPPATTMVNGKVKWPIAGKFGFNVLYCDGHVSTATDPKEAYKSIRMKFPG